MGMRPHLYLLCGMNDVSGMRDDGLWTDPRYHGESWWDKQEDEVVTPTPLGWKEFEEKYGRKHYANWVRMREQEYHRILNGKKFYEVLAYNEEYGLGNILGYILSKYYDDLILWAISGAWHEKFGQPGYLILPSYPLEKDISHDAQVIKVAKRALKNGEEIPDMCKKSLLAGEKMRSVVHGWNIPSIAHETVFYAEMTLYVLRQLGWTVRPRDLKFMIYWYWS